MILVEIWKSSAAGVNLSSVHCESVLGTLKAGCWWHISGCAIRVVALNARWDSADVSTDECFGNRNQIISGAGLKIASSTARAAATFENKGSFWNRRIWDYRNDPAAPVLRIRDEFSGTGAADPKIFSLTLMATGPVETAVGSREVPLSSAPAKPSAGAPLTLAPGVTRLGFKGQWGVDFGLFIVAKRAQQATVTGWKHFWNPTP